MRSRYRPRAYRRREWDGALVYSPDFGAHEPPRAAGASSLCAKTTPSPFTRRDTSTHQPCTSLRQWRPVVLDERKHVPAERAVRGTRTTAGARRSPSPLSQREPSHIPAKTKVDAGRAYLSIASMTPHRALLPSFAPRHRPPSLPSPPECVARLSTPPTRRASRHCPVLRTPWIRRMYRASRLETTPGWRKCAQRSTVGTASHGGELSSTTMTARVDVLTCPSRLPDTVRSPVEAVIRACPTTEVRRVWGTTRQHPHAMHTAYVPWLTSLR